MITPMKKLSIVLLDKDKEESLKKLKSFGVMHLKANLGTSEDSKVYDDALKRIESALRFTSEAAAEHHAHIDIQEIEERISEINELGAKIKQLEDREAHLNKDIEYLEPWGDFNPSDLTILEEKGVKVTLLEVTLSELQELSEEISWFQINKTNLGHLIAVVGECPEGFTEFHPPENGLEDSLAQLDMVMDEIEACNQKMKELSVFHGKIMTYKEHIEDNLEFEQVKAGMSYDELVSVLEGWIPADKTEKFKKLAEKRSWGYMVSDPVEGDETPTLLKSNKFVSMIYPVLDFLGNSPGYWEKDVSPFFLLFFTLFFAMIIGDAGYGAIFLGITALVHAKMKQLHPALALFYLLSGATVIWGAVTGTWFGSELLKGLPWAQKFILPQLSSGTQIMKLCLDIALVHLFLARIYSFLVGIKKGINAFAELGWASVLAGLYFLVLNMVMDATQYPMPAWALPAVAAGFGTVVVFGEQEKGRNFFKSFLIGFAGFPLKILDTISVFADIISYVRLYAVGLAGVAIASSFNVMAEPLLTSGNFTIVFGILILLVGHAFNIAMCALSVLVHGIRLNVLEFSNHSGVNWTGIKFNPFREKNIL